MDHALNNLHYKILCLSNNKSKFNTVKYVLYIEIDNIAQCE